MSFKSSVLNIAYHSSPVRKTRQSRQGTIKRLCLYLKQENIRLKRLKNLKPQHVYGFINCRKSNHIGMRTLRNELTNIRTVLRTAKLEQLAKSIDSRAAGISCECRDTPRSILCEERFAQLLSTVKTRCEGVAAVVELQRSFGLRAPEAIFIRRKMLGYWEFRLKNSLRLKRNLCVPFIYGEKGKLRSRKITPSNPQRALNAVLKARALMLKQGGRLMMADNRAQAINRYNYVMHKSGFKGHESSFSIRYAFAMEQLKSYLDSGYSQKEALKHASCDLGYMDHRQERWRQILKIAGKEYFCVSA